MPKTSESPPTPEQQQARATLGGVLRQLRKARGLSQRAATPFVEVDHSTVSLRESGSDSGVISIDGLVRHVGGLGGHVKIEIVDGPGDFSATYVTPADAAPRDPALDELIAEWPYLDATTRDVLMRVLDMALAAKRGGAGALKQRA